MGNIFAPVCVRRSAVACTHTSRNEPRKSLYPNAHLNWSRSEGKVLTPSGGIDALSTSQVYSFCARRRLQNPWTLTPFTRDGYGHGVITTVQVRTWGLDRLGFALSSRAPPCSIELDG
jgi:hypothetical protein